MIPSGCSPSVMYIHPEEMLPEETFAAGSHSSGLSGVKTVKDSVPAYPAPRATAVPFPAVLFSASLWRPTQPYKDPRGAPPSSSAYFELTLLKKKRKGQLIFLWEISPVVSVMEERSQWKDTVHNK